MTDWQPIETAPKDGMQILIYDPLCGIQQVGFDITGSKMGLTDAWIADDGGTYLPTHWMPLPDPPK
jgi:hypothetical protein